jgi:hypothetical protein
VKSDGENKENSVKRRFRNNCNEDRGDLLIRGLWAHDTDCIIDVRIKDVDANKSDRSRELAKVLAAHEREKKKKCIEAFLEQCPHFSPFVASSTPMVSSAKKPELC